jgi:Mg2+/Co2+ transporter CorC
VESLGPSQWRVNGLTRIDDFRREYPGLGDVPEVETMGGLVLRLAEVVPPVGATFEYRGLRFTVRIADQRRVRELFVEKTGGNG